MPFTEILIAYFEAHLVLSLGSSICILISASCIKRVAFKDIHRLSSILLLFILLYPMTAFFAAKPEFSKASAQLWSEPSVDAPPQTSSPIKSSEAFPASKSLSLPISNLYMWLCAFILSGALVGILPFFRDLKKISRIIREACLLRKIKGVHLFVSSQIETPFSFWIPGKALVLLPTSLLEDPKSFKLAILHELQHHRQKDTKIVFLVQLLKCLFFWNPFVHLLERSIQKIHEFACDEALVDRKDVSPLAYGRCLIAAAETALKTRRQLTGTVGMATSSSGLVLKRRIENMTTQGKKNKSRSITFLLGFLCLGSMGVTAHASKGSIQDRPIPLEEVQKLVHKDAQKTKFPLELNDQVLAQLNRYAGTPEGRNWLKKSIQRKKEYESMILKSIQSYNYPKELMAVALMESGFQNLEAKHNRVKAAGLWQFIPGTARHFNLKVTDQVDERLNPSLQTDAAMRLLGSLYLRFQDWKLALLAYNAGAQRVQEAIDKTGSRDAWALIAKTSLGDKDYLSKVIAGAILLNHPQLIN